MKEKNVVGAGPTGPRISPGIDSIGEQLRRAYADVLMEPVPPKMAELIRHLTEPEEGSEHDG